jgi:hypothetical protein
MLLDQASAGSPKGWSAAPAGACTRDRQERELARFRLHLVKHKSALKKRVHSTLIKFAKPCPVTDLLSRGPRAARTAPGPGALAREHHTTPASRG